MQAQVDEDRAAEGLGDEDSQNEAVRCVGHTVAQESMPTGTGEAW